MPSYFFKARHLKIICSSVLALLLLSCSSPNTPIKTPSAIDKTTQKDLNASAQQSAQSKLEQAMALNARSFSNIKNAQINLLLVESSELFLQEKNYPKALWLANRASNLVDNPATIYRLLMVKAVSLHALNYIEQAHQQLQLAKALTEKVQTATEEKTSVLLTFSYYQTLSAVLQAKSLPVDSATAQLFAFALNTQANAQDVWLLWQQLSALMPWQLAQIAKSNPPFYSGWQQLLSYAHKFAAKPSQFSRYLSLWKQTYPTHPARLIADALANAKLTFDHIENVAILLPLTGEQASAGLAAQQGILAAYNNESSITLHFIDTNQIDWSQLPTRFAELSIDHVIGPLLKKHVTTYLNLSMTNIALQQPSLLLNLPQQHSLTSYQWALSMRPEDEAQQAAAVLSKQNYHAPIILSHQDKASKRIALAFQQTWQTATGKLIDIIYFEQGKQMQANLKESLDVNASQTRINQLSNQLKQTIKAEARNRRDIDMIYLVGSAAQTRLIKPYIDVNISPFADIIPVYASSRSHSYFTDINNENSKNDLQHLTFTQMPWLLNAKQRNQQLAQLSQQLWPKRTDSLSRIFAMGFDSYNLLGKTSLMQQAPYILHFGQTGTLKLNEHNILIRSLVWGRYLDDKVQEIVMD